MMRNLLRGGTVALVVLSGLLLGSHLPMAEASSSGRCAQLGPVTAGTLTFDDGCVVVDLVDVKVNVR